MKTLRALVLLTYLSLVSLSGCQVFDAIPPVEVCFVYKGAKVCAIKRAGEWFFSADLSPADREAVIKDIEAGGP